MVFLRISKSNSLPITDACLIVSIASLSNLLIRSSIRSLILEGILNLLSVSITYRSPSRWIVPSSTIDLITSSIKNGFPSVWVKISLANPFGTSSNPSPAFNNCFTSLHSSLSSSTILKTLSRLILKMASFRGCMLFSPLSSSSSGLNVAHMKTLQSLVFLAIYERSCNEDESAQWISSSTSINGSLSELFLISWSTFSNTRSFSPLISMSLIPLFTLYFTNVSFWMIWLISLTFPKSPSHSVIISSYSSSILLTICLRSPLIPSGSAPERTTAKKTDFPCSI